MSRGHRTSLIEQGVAYLGECEAAWLLLARLPDESDELNDGETGFRPAVLPSDGACEPVCSGEPSGLCCGLGCALPQPPPCCGLPAWLPPTGELWPVGLFAPDEAARSRFRGGFGGDRGLDAMQVAACSKSAKDTSPHAYRAPAA